MRKDWYPRMAYTFLTQPQAVFHMQDGGGKRHCPGGILFRALVELGTGTVAGIETLLTNPTRHELPLQPCVTRRGMFASTVGYGPQWAPTLREHAAYLVRGSLATHPGRIGAEFGATPDRAIVMFDVEALIREPVRAIDLLLACKQAGSRILLDNFDLDDPPARFMEMLPADILRVAPGRMPWHWDAAKRRRVLGEVLAFADNLLMDVAVEDVRSQGQRLEYKRLGVRYAQGAWQRDSLGIVTNSASRPTR